jgi:hypothetical protein
MRGMIRILERGGVPLFASVVALTACSAPASEPREPTPPTSAGAPKSAPTTPAATPPPPPPVPPLPQDVRKVETIARCNTELALFPVGRGWFGICGGAYNRGAAFVVEETGGVRDLPDVLKGLPANATVRAGGGSSIDALELAYDTPGIRGEDRNFVRRRANKWLDMPHSEVPESYLDDRYRSRWVLGLDGYEIGSAPWEGTLRVTDRGGHPKWTPKPAVGTGEDCPRRIPKYLGMARDADGSLWGVGETCEGALAAERFEVGKPGSTVEIVIPAGSFDADDGGGVLTSRDGVVAYANHARERLTSGEYVPVRPPTVVRREAGRWKKLDTSDLGRTDIVQAVVAGNGQALLALGDGLARVGADGIEPFLAGAYSVVVAPDRTAWAYGKRDVYRWIDGRIERVTVVGDEPAGREIVGIHFATDGRPLIVARTAGQDGTRLLRQLDQRASSPKPLELSGERPFTSPFSDFFPLRSPNTRYSCQPALVLLYRLSKTAPADYDFPATRAALKGQKRFEGVSFVELDAVGERHFVAVVRDDVALAFALANKIESDVRGSKPLVFCSHALTAQLPIRRELDIDLATGELRKPAAKP